MDEKIKTIAWLPPVWQLAAQWQTMFTTWNHMALGKMAHINYSEYSLFAICYSIKKEWVCIYFDEWIYLTNVWSRADELCFLLLNTNYISSAVTNRYTTWGYYLTSYITNILRSDIFIMDALSQTK